MSACLAAHLFRAGAGREELLLDKELKCSDRRGCSCVRMLEHLIPFLHVLNSNYAQAFFRSRASQGCRPLSSVSYAAERATPLCPFTHTRQKVQFVRMFEQRLSRIQSDLSKA